MMKQLALTLVLTGAACTDSGEPGSVNPGGDPCIDNPGIACAQATFVSAKIGSDANPGTRELPVATIGAALTNAVTIGRYPTTIILGEGAYVTKVELNNEVSILGGYQCDATACTWQRDIFSYESAIVDVDFEGLVAHSGVTAATVIDGVMVVGIDGAPTVAPGGAAVTLDGGSPTLRASRFHGGNITGGAAGSDGSVGLLVRGGTDSADVTIYGNEIVGGRAAGLSAGLVLSGAGAERALVTGNTIRGGDGARSVGLLATNTIDGSVVERNDIASGDATVGASDGLVVSSALTINANHINTDRASVGACASTTAFCTGLTSLSATATITNNVILGGNGARTAGVVLAETERPGGEIVLNSNLLDGGGATSTAGTSAALVVSIGACATCGFTGVVGRVRNNVLVGGSNQMRFGILENPAQGHTIRPDVIDNNDIWFTGGVQATDTLYRRILATGEAADFATVDLMNDLALPSAAANLAVNPLYDTTWHAMTGSPCANAGTASDAPARDMDNQLRTGITDIGPDEL
jgi:hypothetical protein